MLNYSYGAHPEELARSAEGKLLFKGSKLTKGISIDSRNVSEGDLFVAILGERTDGHNYIASAAEKGASAVLISDEKAEYGELEQYGCSVILVPDTVLALGKIAKAHIAECSARVTAVTGSVGKTTTRQLIYSVLSSSLSTHKTDGNFNNEIGLPISVLKMDSSNEAAVFELGMSAKGEISYLTHIVRPSVAVITNIGTCHIEYLGSREGIRDAKMEIAEGLDENGILLLNGDEPLLQGIDRALYVALENKNADFRADHIKYTENGMIFDAVCQGRIIPSLSIPLFGEHAVLDAMFAVACGIIYGISDQMIRNGLMSYESVGMRQNIKKINDITYIFDYYNASPESIKASLNVTRRLADAAGGRAVGIIGSVLELGESSEALHRSVGDFASSCCDILFTFGEEADFIAKQAVHSGMSKDCVFSYPDITNPKPIAERAAETVTKNDCVLLKASHSVHLERVAELLTELKK